MNAMPPTFAGSHDAAAPSRDDASLASARWAALTDAATVVASLAGEGPGCDAADEPSLADLMQGADPWRRERAERGIADISAFMEQGIAALLSVTARGADPRPAAQALWDELIAARAAVLSLLRAGLAA